MVGSCSGILLGRRTYEMFAPAWSARTADDDPGAPFFNGSPKHVVSSTLRDPEWANTTVSAPTRRHDPRPEVRLRRRPLRERQRTLVQAMLADGLVDELHLFVYPLALRRRVCGCSPTARVPARLNACESFDSGVVHLGYSAV